MYLSGSGVVFLAKKKLELHFDAKKSLSRVRSCMLFLYEVDA